MFPPSSSFLHPSIASTLEYLLIGSFFHLFQAVLLLKINSFGRWFEFSVRRDRWQCCFIVCTWKRNKLIFRAVFRNRASFNRIPTSTLIKYFTAPQVNMLTLGFFLPTKSYKLAFCNPIPHFNPPPSQTHPHTHTLPATNSYRPFSEWHYKEFC